MLWQAASPLPGDPDGAPIDAERLARAEQAVQDLESGAPVDPAFQADLEKLWANLPDGVKNAPKKPEDK
jgi:hypothetical protein